MQRKLKKKAESDVPEDILLLVLNPQHDQNRFFELELPAEWNRFQVFYVNN